MEAKLTKSVAEELAYLIPDTEFTILKGEEGLFHVGYYEEANVKILCIEDDDNQIIYVWALILNREFEYGKEPKGLSDKINQLLEC